jgi:endonuclease III related protein
VVGPDLGIHLITTPMPQERTTLLLNCFAAMLERMGPSHWWPGDSPFEIAVGAILTQNTNWRNVEKAIWNLKTEDLLSPEKLYALPLDRLAEFIRPAGYFRIKAARLKSFLQFLRLECRLDMEHLKQRENGQLRDMLLNVKGIGPETADSILLYALEKPTFVVDAYTRRIFSRHGLINEELPYADLREFFMSALPQDVQLYNEYHALLVRVGKGWCGKKEGQCADCPLSSFMPRKA